MSTATEHGEHAEHPAAEAHAHDHPTDKTFIKVAIFLAVLTALETSTYWWPESIHTISMATLLILMAIKFFVIVSWFMHLRFDSKWFSLLFYIGIVLAVGCYMVALLTFRFFG